MSETPHLHLGDTNASVISDAGEPQSGVSPEASEIQIKLSSAIETFMLNPHLGNLAEEPTKRAAYGGALGDFVTHNFNLSLLLHDRFPGQDYNPVLYELGNMIVSLDHNAGVYYPEEDVIDLFGVIAACSLGTPDVQQKLALATDAGSVKGFDAAYKEGVEATFSLDRNDALALVKDQETGWRVVDGRDFEGNDFTPLEVTRQDNADKAGQKKYRFRMATYTHQRDEVHDQSVAEDWFTSEWMHEPNYWSQQLRTALGNGLAVAESRLQDTDSNLALLTEGGILKGTSTAGTDLDTTCLVLAHTKEDFDTAYQALAPAFSDELEQLPFQLKEDQGVSTRFIDRRSGAIYFRDERTGDYLPSDWDQLFNGSYVFQIRKHEKGVGVTTSIGFQAHKKPAAIEADGTAFLSIDIATGTVAQLTGESLTIYKNDLQRLHQARHNEARQASDWI